MKNSKIELFDTNLKDGVQGEGVDLSVEDKFRLASLSNWSKIDVVRY